MGDPPRINIRPDQQGHGLGQTGHVLEFRVDMGDNAIEAKVTWSEPSSYRNPSRTHRRTEWLPVDRLEPMPGEVYTGVTRTRIGQQEGRANSDKPSEAPPGWPAGVPGPDVDGWIDKALGWLLDQLPPDFRAYPILIQQPTALIWMARAHLRHSYTAIVQGYRTAPVELRASMPPHAMSELDAVYRAEKERLIGCGQAVNAIEQALRAHRGTPSS